MGLVLRDYQRRAVDAVWKALQRSDQTAPCVSIPTGGGKTAVIAELCRVVAAAGGRVLVLAHVKELLVQNYKTILHHEPGLEGSVGLLSAGLGVYQTDRPILVAGIQTACRRLGQLAPRDVVIVDEAHRIPPKGEGMYRSLLKDLGPGPRLVGMTATPFRMRGGSISGPDRPFTEIVCEIKIGQLVKAGWLCRMKNCVADRQADISEVRVVAGDYVRDELEQVFTAQETCQSQVDELLRRAEGRHHVLVFCCGVAHATEVVRLLRQKGEGADLVVESTRPDERAAVLERFRAGGLRFMVNVNVFCEGFDYPGVDCVALLRATQSPGLYCQMVGRGLRVAEEKPDCLLVDFGGNCLRHGPVDAVVPSKASTPKNDGQKPPLAWKVCPGCQGIVSIGDFQCRQCGCELTPQGWVRCPSCRAPALAGIPSCPQCGGALLTNLRVNCNATPKPGDPVTTLPQQVQGQGLVVPPLPSVRKTLARVVDVSYTLHTKREAPEGHPRTLRVTYKCEAGLRRWWISEFVCLEHEGYARKKAEHWWCERSDLSPPETVRQALEVAEEGLLREPCELELIDSGGKWPSIGKVEFVPF